MTTYMCASCYGADLQLPHDVGVTLTVDPAQCGNAAQVRRTTVGKCHLSVPRKKKEYFGIEERIAG